MADQQKHLYSQSGLGKVRWFIARFGVMEMLFKPLRTIFAPFIVPRLPKADFLFNGVSLPLFYHAYNMTWACERCVEVPVARSYLAKVESGSALEVGNVLSHYGAVSHSVLDKFEVAPGVINADIVDYAPGRRFDLIFAVSTFEHIGFDDDSTDGSLPKIAQAINSCRKLLSPTGMMVITIPVGYNPELDEAIQGGALPARAEHFLGKFNKFEWRSVAKGEALKMKYRCRFPYANAVAVLEFGPISAG